MDYGFPEKRKSKNDKRAKGRYNRYKRGGRWRVQERPGFDKGKSSDN